ncbi:hypothetical protein [Halomicrococcus sp. SG-WS-1]|uniref:hypothetical protein n=1 Tax=Halomicrococcus sp. SG-WS-1 TaxID=3439057 RepID=UPI003F7AB918
MNSSLIEATLERLSRVFHQEADLQQALAWNLHQHFPSLTIRAEYPVQGITTDLWLIDDDERMAIELKYPKKSFKAQAEDESYEFGNDPTDVACYGYLADIERLETLIAEGSCEQGAAVIVTNDALLWENQPNGANYDEFKLYDGRTVSGRHSWAEDASISGSRSQPIDLASEYTLDWQDYSYSYPSEASGDTSFKYCISEIS